MGSGLSSWKRHTVQRGGEEHSAWWGESSSCLRCWDKTNSFWRGQERERGREKVLGWTGRRGGEVGCWPHTQLQGPRNGVPEAGRAEGPAACTVMRLEQREATWGRSSPLQSLRSDRSHGHGRGSAFHQPQLTTVVPPRIIRASQWLWDPGEKSLRLGEENARTGNNVLFSVSRGWCLGSILVTFWKHFDSALYVTKISRISERCYLVTGQWVGCDWEVQGTPGNPCTVARVERGRAGTRAQSVWIQGSFQRDTSSLELVLFFT